MRLFTDTELELLEDAIFDAIEQCSVEEAWKISAYAKNAQKRIEEYEKLKDKIKILATLSDKTCDGCRHANDLMQTVCVDCSRNYADLYEEEV